MTGTYAHFAPLMVFNCALRARFHHPKFTLGNKETQCGDTHRAIFRCRLVADSGVMNEARSLIQSADVEFSSTSCVKTAYRIVRRWKLT